MCRFFDSTTYVTGSNMDHQFRVKSIKLSFGALMDSNLSQSVVNEVQSATDANTCALDTLTKANGIRYEEILPMVYFYNKIIASS